MKPIRIMLAEDQTLMRQGLKTILELEDGFEVAGEAEDGKAAVKLALSPARTVIETGCWMKTGAEGLVSTVRVAFELVTISTGLLTTTE